MTSRENSVKQLAELYNVVIGVALSLSITKIVDVSATTLPIKTDNIFIFLTYIVIIIPFHQSAVRHLFATYVENGGSSRIKQGALAVDFIILFAQACIFVIMGALIDKVQLFTNSLIILLAIDCVWGLLSYLAFTGAQAQNAEQLWSKINLIAGFILFFATIFGPKLLNGWGMEMQQIIFAVIFIRTVIDYYTSWDFYYPKK